MRRVFSAALVAACSACSAPRLSDAARPPRDVRPTLEEIFGEPALDGVRPSDPALSADGRFVSYTWSGADAARPAGDPNASRETPRARLYVVDAAGGGAVDLGSKRGAQWLPVGAELAWFDERAITAWRAGTPLASAKPWCAFDASPDDLRFSPDASHALVGAGGKKFILECAKDGGAPVKLGELTAPSALPFERIECLDDGVMALLGRTERARGGRGGDRGASRPASAPASEPAGGATHAPMLAFWGWDATLRWSAPLEIPDGWALDNWFGTPEGDGAWIVLHESDRPAAQQGMLAHFLTEKVTSRPARFRNASDVDTRKQLMFFDGRGARLAAVPEMTELRRGNLEVLPVRRGSGGARALAAWNAEDRSARTVCGLTATAAAGGEASAAEIRRDVLLSVPGPVAGGDRLAGRAALPLALSDGGGRMQAYAWNGDRTLTAFTPAGVEVQWLGVPARAGASRVAEVIGLASSPDRPHERRFWRFFTNGEPHAELPMHGMWAESPSLARNGSAVAFLGAELGRAEDVYILPADGSAAPKRLTFTAPDPPTPDATPQVVHYPGLDGADVWAYLYEPPAGVRRNGAAVIFLHGAGFLQEVRASLGFPGYVVNHHFHRRLAALGYTVLCPDFRGSSGYGRKFRTDVYQKLGIPDSDDIVAGKRWLVENRGVAPGRIGLYGGSYGGFLTLMCLMRHPREFACGAALRSVTDWRAYTSEYTRPLLGGGPAEVPAVYAATSPIDLAKSLERPLLILHGMEDDNVFVQDSIRLVEELQKLGKTDLFELMLYPSQNHTFTTPYSWIDEYRRIETFFWRHLK